MTEEKKSPTTYYIIDNGMAHSDHGLFFVSVPEEYEHLDQHLRLVLPYLVSGEAENPHNPKDGKHLVMVSRDVDVIQKGHTYFWTSLEEVIGSWSGNGDLTKRVKNLIEMPPDRTYGKKRYMYGEPHEKTVPVSEDVHAAAATLLDALPADWFR